MTESELKKGASSAESGKSYYRAKKYLQAAEAFSKAAEHYAAGGDPLVAAEMRNNQCVALLMGKRPHQALDAVAGTSEILLDGGETIKGAMALANQAAAFKDLKEYEQAIEYFLLAADSFQAAGEEEMYLQTMQSVSSLKMKNRNLMGALFSLQSGLEAVEKPTWRQKVLKSLLGIPDKLLGK